MIKVAVNIAYRYTCALNSIAEWLERVECVIDRIPPLKAFYIRVLICRLSITSLPLLLTLTAVTVVVAVLQAVGMVGASVQWWLHGLSG